MKTGGNQILMKNILFSETLYQKELLKLMDRSIAENIIVYLIEKFPKSFRKISLNLKIYNDIKNYYKNNNEKLAEFENKNSDKIKTIIKDISNIKEQGNFAAHPKESKPTITNDNKHIFEIP